MVTGGMPVGPDGRIHTTFTRNANTLRLTSVGPNLQNIPRGGEWGKLVKQMFVAPEGSLFWARDYSGIEAVLVGVFANSPVYLRLAQIDIHSYFTCYKLYELDHAIPAADVPDPGWTDADLRGHLSGIKKRFKADRQALKHVGHLTNYMGGAYKTQEVLLKELGTAFPIKDIQKMIEVYMAIFPDIPRWHASTCLAVDALKKVPDPLTGRTGVCWIKNPFGFVMRFHNVLDWTCVEQPGGGKEWVWEYGKDAKALIASNPQSTAAFIYTEAMMRLEERRPDVAETVRLLVHDEILGEARREFIDECLQVSKEIMEEPIPQIPLDPNWGLGNTLRVFTEGKVGQSWATMQEVK
jgi:DNA polymerase I-like protein with 3'-5' exonuclease and polymerase domains